MQKHRRWIHEAKRKPFRYGEWDCVLAVCDYAFRVHGLEQGKAVAEKYRTKFADIMHKRSQGKTEEELFQVRQDVAYEILEEGHSGSLVRGICDHIGNGLHPNKAQVGDIGILILQGREICAIRDNYQWWITATKGLRPVPQNVANPIKCWRIKNA